MRELKKLNYTQFMLNNAENKHITTWLIPISLDKKMLTLNCCKKKKTIFFHEERIEAINADRKLSGFDFILGLTAMHRTIVGGTNKIRYAHHFRLKY